MKYVYMQISGFNYIYGSKSVSRYLIHNNIIYLVHIKFDTKFGLPSVMFKTLHHHLSCVYKPTSPLLFPTHLHMSEQVFFFDLRGA
jgi:hypothetical protein